MGSGGFYKASYKGYIRGSTSLSESFYGCYRVQRYREPLSLSFGSNFQLEKNACSETQGAPGALRLGFGRFWACRAASG